MAEISYLQLYDPNDAVRPHQLSGNHHHRRGQILSEVIDSLCYCPHADDLDFYVSVTEFPAAEGVVPCSLISAAEGLDLLDRHNFVMDLFHQRVEQSQVTSQDNIENNDLGSESGLGAIEGNCEIGIDRLELDLGIGLELEFGGLEENSSVFVVENIEDGDIDVSVDVNANDDDYHDGDHFLVERRVSGLESHEAASTVCPFGNEIRVIGFGSDSDNDEHEHENLNERGRLGIDLNVDDEYLNDDGDDDASVTIPLCWNSLQLEDRRETDEDFEWEEVDDHVVDEREVLSVFAEADNDDENSISISISSITTPEDLARGDRERGLGNLGWEVLLNSRNFETNLEVENNLDPYFGDHDDYLHTTEYEMLFEEFAEAEIQMNGLPPASKAFVKNLPVVVLAKEDVENNNVVCAVCKDEMIVGDEAVKLTCKHRYHRECIVPWLGIRNTCPVCRHELPTDDAEYERRKSQSAARRM